MKKRGKEKPQAATLKSDEEIIAERKRLETFDTADSFLSFFSWGLWVLAAIWFLYLSDVEDAAAESPDRHGPSDATLSLLVCGFFSRGISQATPRCWSWWRRGFHLGCAIFVFLISFALVFATWQKHWQAHQQASSVAMYSGIGFFAVLAAAVWTLPTSSPAPAKVASSPYGRLLFLLDGLAGSFVGVSILVGYDLGAGFARLTALVTAGPLILCSLGMIFVCSEAELLVASLAGMVMYLGAFLRCSYLFGPIAASPLVLAVVIHASLYLPLPWQDPSSNVFHSALRRRWRGFMKLMSVPSAGFGESAED